MQTAPFLIRAFIKVGAFHRLTQFEDGPLPIAEEQQIYAWYVICYMSAVQSLTTALQERCHAS